jgi:hypothetical protein
MGSGIEEYNVGTHKRCGGQVDRYCGDWGGYIEWLQCSACGKEVSAEALKRIKVT